MRVPRHRPLRAKRIIAALSSDRKLSILEELAQSPRSPTELSKKAKTSLAAMSTQLKELEEAGLIRVLERKRIEKGRPSKFYSLADDEVTIEIALKLYSRVPKEKEIADMVMEYAEKKLESNGLSPSPSVSDIAETLGKDERLAMVILNSFREKRGDVLSLISSKVEERINEIKEGGANEASITDLTEELNLDRYWAVMALAELEKAGTVEMSGGKVRFL